jgi:hypothetical protein
MWNAADVARACRAGRVCLAGFALVTLPHSLAEAEYGPRTVFGANYEQTSNTLSLNGTNEASCNSYGSCMVLFQRAPGQKRLIVQHVSCDVTTSANLAIRRVALWSKGQTLLRRYAYLTPIRTGSISTKTFWNVNSPVMHLIESGERPLVFFDTGFGSDWVAECTIAGKLLQP